MPRKKGSNKRDSKSKKPDNKRGSAPDKIWQSSYPESVPLSLSYSSVSLPQMLSETVRQYPQRAALSFYGKTISYTELQSLSDRFTRALQGLGVRKGDRVALLLPNCPQQVIAFFAVQKAGAMAVPLNPLYTVRELRDILADAEASHVVTLKQFAYKIGEISGGSDLEAVVLTSIADYFPLPLQVLYRAKSLFSGSAPLDDLAGRVYDFQDLINHSLGDYHPVSVQPGEDFACLMYTSGTTGRPRGVPLTHLNLIDNVEQISAFTEGMVIPGEEIQLGVLPFFHIYGLNFVMNYAVKHGFTLILLPRFSTKSVCRVIKQEKITILPAVPAIYRALMSFSDQKPRRCDFSTLKFCGSGASPCLSSLIKKVRETTGAVFVEAYGLTETSPVTHMNPPSGVQKAGSIGIPLPDTEAKVVDHESGQELPVGETGELLLKGPQVFAGYWGEADPEIKVIDGEGWFKTGDMASMDEDGYFYIKGRKDDMINVGGEKVWPREVEEILEDHPLVEETAVVAEAHRFYGQVPRAYVVLTSPGISEEKLIGYCRSKLVKYKVPRKIEFLDEIPRSHLNKKLRYQLRESDKTSE